MEKVSYLTEKARDDFIFRLRLADFLGFCRERGFGQTADAVETIFSDDCDDSRSGVTLRGLPEDGGERAIKK